MLLTLLMTLTVKLPYSYLDFNAGDNFRPNFGYLTEVQLEWVFEIGSG